MNSNNSTENLNVGDEIGFVKLASGIDGIDTVMYFPIVEVTDRDGERAYYYQYPDGARSSAAFKHSQLASHMISVRRTVPVAAADTPDALLICISDRRAEFREALERGENWNLQVIEDFERDNYIVRNLDNGNEYRVMLETVGIQVYAACECPDYSYRSRVCKHISEVLAYLFIGVPKAAQATPIAPPPSAALQLAQ